MTLLLRWYRRSPAPYMGNANVGAPSGRRPFALVAAVLVFTAFLHITYAIYMSPKWGYIGFLYRVPSPVPYGTAIAVAVFVAFTLPVRISRTSDMILWLLYGVVVAPTLLISQYNPLLSHERATVLGLNTAACLMLTRVLSRIRPRLYLDRAFMELQRYFPVLVALVIVAVLGDLALTGGLSFNAVGIFGVYQRRADFVVEQNGSLVAGYMAPALFYVIGPTLMGLGIYRRRRLLFVSAGLMEFLLYLSVAYKTILFAIIAIPVVVYALNRPHPPTGARILVWTVGIATIFGQVDQFLGVHFLNDLFVRRFLYIPGVFSSVYGHVFWDAGKTNFHDTVPIFASNSSGDSPARVVGQEFFHNSATNASASLWSHGFGSYGIIGMYVETLVLVLLLWIADDCSQGLPLPICGAIFFMPALAVSQASVFTSIFTHGFLAACVVAVLLQRSDLARGASPTRGASSSRISTHQHFRKSRGHVRTRV